MWFCELRSMQMQMLMQKDLLNEVVHVCFMPLAMNVEWVDRSSKHQEVPVIGSDWPKLEAQTLNCIGVMSVFAVQNWSVFTTLNEISLSNLKLFPNILRQVEFETVSI